jgi:hypothetical protein
MMKSGAAHKATTRAEENVGVIRRKSGKGIKGKTVNSNGDGGREHRDGGTEHRDGGREHRDGGREHRTLIESEPVGTGVARHWILNYPGPIHPFFYTRDSVKDVSLSKHHQTKEGTKGVERTNMGLAHTIGEGTEHLGISSSQIPTICSLPEFHRHNTFTQ